MKDENTNIEKERENARAREKARAEKEEKDTDIIYVAGKIVLDAVKNVGIINDNDIEDDEGEDVNPRIDRKLGD